MQNARSGYLLEHRYSNVSIIDETDKTREFPEHHATIGPLLVWREDTIPNPNGKDLKITYYRHEMKDPMDPKKTKFIHTAIMTNYDQNLSSISMDVIKKQADPESQRRISRFTLMISWIITLFLIVQQTLNPEDQLLLDINPSNAGWLLFVFAIFKIIDLMQERPAVFSALFVQYWAQVFNPSEGQKVNVAFCTMHLTDKMRISDQIPIKIEQQHVLAHFASRKKAEDRAEARYQEYKQVERTAEDQKRTISEFEALIKAAEKSGYVRGLRDGKHSPVMKNTAHEFHRNYPNITWPAALIVIAMVFYGLVKNISVQFPDAVFIVELAQFPMIFWVLLFVLAFFIVRWFFTLLGVVR